MEIKRDVYLNRLISRKFNGSIKVITGIRRCGKSYLLTRIFRDHLLSEGVPEDHIINIALDDRSNKNLRDPDVLYGHVADLVKEGQYYLFLDEIQFVDGFEEVLNGLNRMDNLDIYVTGSNSKFLSKDVITEFRGRGDEIEVRPLSFSEFITVYPGDRYSAWNEYMMFGGMPEVLSKRSEEEKIAYLQRLVNTVYLSDIIERNRIRSDDLLDMIFDSLCSAIGSLTNPLRVANTLQTKGYKGADNETVSKYMGHLTDSFLFEVSKRYNVKGRKYYDTPAKYYATDVGLRNAKLNFRQNEPTHIMENIIYNELRYRGFCIDVGIIEERSRKEGRNKYKQLEIDFVANKGSKRYYVQSAFSIPDKAKEDQETDPLDKVDDSFKKVIITGDNTPPRRNERGYLTVNVIDFLLDADSLDL